MRYPAFTDHVQLGLCPLRIHSQPQMQSPPRQSVATTSCHDAFQHAVEKAPFFAASQIFSANAVTARSGRQTDVNKRSVSAIRHSVERPILHCTERDRSRVDENGLGPCSHAVSFRINRSIHSCSLLSQRTIARDSAAFARRTFYRVCPATRDQIVVGRLPLAQSRGRTTTSGTASAATKIQF